MVKCEKTVKIGYNLKPIKYGNNDLFILMETEKPDTMGRFSKLKEQICKELVIPPVKLRLTSNTSMPEENDMIFLPWNFDLEVKNQSSRAIN